MVERLQRSGYVRDPRVCEALVRVPRERFLSDPAREAAYEDAPLSIGEGQTVSAPHMVAIVLENADLQAGQRVLEVGGGSGYLAALAADLVSPGGNVVAVEIHARLAERARAALAEMGYSDRVRVVLGDGAEGAPGEAPFDRILVSCAAPRVPPPLLAALKPGGRLLAPVGDRDLQDLLLVEPLQGGGFRTRTLGACRFVPLTGPHGFPP